VTAAAWAALALAAAASQSAPTAPERSEGTRRKLASHSPLPPPPASPTNRFADDARAAELGQRLFFDPRLSSNGEVSCATCHDPKLGFADRRPLAMGLSRGDRHTPGLWNVAYQRWFFWDGRADSLWAQAVQPLENPVEMGGDRVAVARLLAGDPELREAYTKVFGSLPDTSRWPEHARPAAEGAEDPLGKAWLAMGEDARREANRVTANFGKALEAYERRLLRRESPFDRYVAGEASALSESAERGLVFFMGPGGCRSCHGGPAFTDSEFHNIGIPPLGGGKPTDPARYAGVERVLRDPFNARSEFSDSREGEPVTRLDTLAPDPRNFGEYRTPSLRNVALTPPYMHQGQFATLRDVIRFYSTLEGATQVGHHQEQTLRPLNLSDSEIEDLVAFLESLTGAPPPDELLAPPAGR
jgi:cytochrome c peroxidase